MVSENGMRYTTEKDLYITYFPDFFVYEFNVADLF